MHIQRSAECVITELCRQSAAQLFQNMIFSASGNINRHLSCNAAMCEVRLREAVGWVEVRQVHPASISWTWSETRSGLSEHVDGQQWTFLASTPAMHWPDLHFSAPRFHLPTSLFPSWLPCSPVSPSLPSGSCQRHLQQYAGRAQSLMRQEKLSLEVPLHFVSLYPSSEVSR